MLVLITGGNGFLGLNIVEALIAKGHSVRAYVRQSSDVSYLNVLRVDLIRGELSDTSALIQAMNGVHAVIHTAGITSCDVNDIDELLQVNRDCTASVCEAALASGVKRLVYTSTTSTIGAKNDKEAIADEEQKLMGFRAKNPYGISKKEAEVIVQEYSTRGLETIILCPAEVVGAYDYNFQWGRIVLAVYHNALPFMPPGGGSFCHAKDVAKAHVNALTLGRSGEKYLLSGQNITFLEYITEVAAQLDKSFDIPEQSYRDIYYKARMYERYPSDFEKPAVEAYRMRVFSGFYYFSSVKATCELEYQISPLNEMVEDCISWYIKVGIISSV